MAAICPELLDEYETFYQLGLGGQPKGSLGDFASLDLGQNQARLLDLLDRLFAQSPLAPQVATYQRRAYAHACFALGQLSYGARQMSDARGFLIRAITYSPGYIRNRQVAVTLAKSYAGGTGIEQLRSVRRLLTVSGRSG
jgi:NAD(P)-dependent dehydrogenase (short-subunit alcohol dehydrogenase family)